MMETPEDRQRLFTLTAEEVELVRQALMTEKNVIIDVHVKYPAIDAYIIKARDKINNLLSRIKEWKDESE